MGLLPILFTVGLVCFGTLRYFNYTNKRVNLDGAIFHLFQRLGRRRFDGLDRELRNILKEKGLRSDDPFDQTVARSFAIDLLERQPFEKVVQLVAEQLEHRVPGTAKEIFDDYQLGTRVGATPVTHGVALPRIRKAGLMQAEMVIVRSRQGIVVPPDAFDESEADKIVHALFFLVSPDEDPGQHLQILAQIAERVDDEDFMEAWLTTETDQQLREILLRDDRFLTLVLDRETALWAYIEKSLNQLQTPEGALVALIRRGYDILVPRGNTQLHRGDRLTIIGDRETIRQMTIDLDAHLL